MRNMSRRELLELLDDIRARIANGDSDEGNLQYLISSNGDHPYDVAGAYRIRNSVRLIGIPVRDEPLGGAA